jgi:hypothetical protein
MNLELSVEGKHGGNADVAGLILEASSAFPVSNFFCNNDEAMTELEELAKLEAAH